MRRVSWTVVAAVGLLVGLLGAAGAAGLNEAAVVAQLTAADHEIEEGYFSIGEGATVIAKPGSDLHRWLSAHRGQKVRLRVETTLDGLKADPALRPGTGRDSGVVSRHPQR
jgi:hypothetical protein